ncbi:DUF6708 domain-containing protein [Xanthomonas fragariae]|uniref:DUF6708 domain-containing protein n=2 Tax=Xanthomonas fragariae TaxID=48664 RepID=UPI0003A1A7A7|nr:DUF6708 domain-containing protein [Xanthomonas fragariae]
MNEVKNPAYRVLLPEWQGGEPQFDVPPAQLKLMLSATPHRVAPVDKRQPVHERASSCESLVAVYPNAISIGSILGAGTERGDVGFGGWMTLFGSLVFFWAGFAVAGFADPMTWFLIFPIASFFFVAALYLLKKYYILPRDQPVIFNRKTRQVTFSRIRHAPFWKFWIMPGFLEPQTVAWETVQARTYKFNQLMGETMRDSYRLELWAPHPDDPKKLYARESIGYLGWYEDELLWRLYEHIRRYMEEDGPPIQPGETLRKRRTGRDLEPFNQEIMATVGGPALSREHVEELAERVCLQQWPGHDAGKAGWRGRGAVAIRSRRGGDRARCGWRALPQRAVGSDHRRVVRRTASIGAAAGEWIKRNERSQEPGIPCAVDGMAGRRAAVRSAARAAQADVERDPASGCPGR